MNAPTPDAFDPTHFGATFGAPYTGKYRASPDGPTAVIRIPVVGPRPFNTLVYARFRFSLPLRADWGTWGDLWREVFTMPTPVVLADYDAEDERQRTVKHSTTASLRALETTPELGVENDSGSSFTFAVDSIASEAKVDDSGRVLLSVEHAWNFDDRTDAGLIVFDLSSWMLIYEPRAEIQASEEWWRTGRMRTPNWIPPAKGLARKPPQ